MNTFSTAVENRDDASALAWWRRMRAALRLPVMDAHQQPSTVLRLQLELESVRLALLQCEQALLTARAAEHRAYESALHDSLTLLPNRLSLERRLDCVLSDCGAASPSVAVLFLDLDGFKSINDGHGHDVGDGLLQVVADRLKRLVRADDLVSRLGGDEFVCILRGLDSRERLAALASQMILAVSAPSILGNATLRIRPSIGIAMFPEDGPNRAALMRSADRAMYRAKLTRSGYSFANADNAATDVERPGADLCGHHHHRGRL